MRKLLFSCLRAPEFVLVLLGTVWALGCQNIGGFSLGAGMRMAALRPSSGGGRSEHRGAHVVGIIWY